MSSLAIGLGVALGIGLLIVFFFFGRFKTNETNTTDRFTFFRNDSFVKPTNAVKDGQFQIGGKRRRKR